LTACRKRRIWNEGKKKNLLKVLQAKDLFGAVEAAEPLKELLKQKIYFRSCEQKLVVQAKKKILES
jgi:hypothetical protein